MTHRLTVVIVTLTLVNIISAQNTTDAPEKNVNEKNKTVGDYKFSYYVKDESTGDFKTQEETREGDTVRGSYSVADPNGSLRTVTYTAGQGKGFQAVVDVKKKNKNIQRELNTDMEMMPPKRRPKPKKPMGNDIGVARVLESDVRLTPGGYIMDVSSKPTSDLKTTVSVDFSKNATEDVVEEEIKEVFDSMPKLPELNSSDNSSHLAFEKDLEEVSLDERITQVARQLAETSLRREFEEKKLGHNFPITLQENGEEKSGKAFESPAKPLPLVSRFPPETAQLQLISEVQSVPQPIYKEGFFPVTPAPELSGPLLGGPPLKKKTTTTETPDVVNSLPDRKNNQSDVKPEGKNLKFDENLAYMPQIATIPLRIPAYLRFMIPNDPNERVYPVFLNVAPYPISRNRNYIYNDDYYKAGFLRP